MFLKDAITRILANTWAVTLLLAICIAGMFALTYAQLITVPQLKAAGGAFALATGLTWFRGTEAK